eukprot:comp22772_c0_seq1/m.35610 comp22772_c0_seq1/g.35610  ORF comp22772_c0_seq1/g.35610 comp22772_c0_seq1/m.35610 type:complete len:441 (-) comp22772_c0_seq1:611-1933(-)
MGQAGSKRFHKYASTSSADAAGQWEGQGASKAHSHSKMLNMIMSKKGLMGIGGVSPRKMEKASKSETAMSPSTPKPHHRQRKGSGDNAGNREVKVQNSLPVLNVDSGLKKQRTKSTSIQHISDRLTLERHASSGSAFFFTGIGDDFGAVDAVKSLQRLSSHVREVSKSTEVTKKEKAQRKEELKGALGGHWMSNSCSTLFVDQTVSRPDLDQILMCAAAALHTHLSRVLRLSDKPPFDPIFDEKLHPLTSRTVPDTYATRCPGVKEIYDFLKAFFRAAVLKADIALVAMVYVSRMEANGSLAVQPANWKRVVLGAIMLATKVWDDQAVWNSDFCLVLPDVTLDSMNALERKVLELVDFDVGISASEYAQNYFDLRHYGYLGRMGGEGGPPSPLSLKKAATLDALSGIAKDAFVETPAIRNRVMSSDNLASPPKKRPVILS